MLSVYYALTAVNIAAAALVGLFLALSARRDTGSFKLVHLGMLLLCAVELAYLAVAEAAPPLQREMLPSILLQIVWSCVLLYSAFRLESLAKSNAQLYADLQKHRQLYAEIKSMALSDGLTNIANRRSFDLFLKTELRRAAALNKPVSLIIMDLDRFKSYNDTFGHLTGDKLLSQIGQILRHHVRSSDLPARYGGEEFSIILPDIGLDEAASVAENLRRIIESSNFPDHSGSFTAKITASFGIATYDPATLEQIPDCEKIISIADKALYKAKQQGRNRVFASTIFQ